MLRLRKKYVNSLWHLEKKYLVTYTPYLICNQDIEVKENTMGWECGQAEKQKMHTEFLWKTFWKIILFIIHALLSLTVNQPGRNINEEY